MTETVSTSRKIGAFSLETDSVGTAYASIIDHLTIRFCLLQPNKSVTDFHEEILKPLAESNLDDPITINLTYVAAHSETTYPVYMTELLKACTHCIQAHMADEDDKESLAWRHVSNAMYHLGMLEASLVLEPAIAHIVSSRAQSGSVKRTQKYLPLREHARDLASKKIHTSKRAAVFAIMDGVVAKADELGVYMSPPQRERTITTWLDGMSFGSKRES